MIKLSKKKKIIILVLIIALEVYAIILASSKERNARKVAQELSGPQAQYTVPVATSTTKDEIAPSKNVIVMATATPEIIKDSIQVAPGASLITKDNVVITPEGAPVKLNVMPASKEAPKESAPVDLAKIPSGTNTVKLSVSAAGFEPKTFVVKEGQLVNFALTATDEFTHVFLFDDRSLIASALGVARGETRMKSWNAPKKGTYTFKCSVPGHDRRGEVGTMVVE